MVLRFLLARAIEYTNSCIAAAPEIPSAVYYRLSGQSSASAFWVCCEPLLDDDTGLGNNHIPLPTHETSFWTRNSEPVVTSDPGEYVTINDQSNRVRSPQPFYSSHEGRPTGHYAEPEDCSRSEWGAGTPLTARRSSRYPIRPASYLEPTPVGSVTADSAHSATVQQFHRLRDHPMMLSVDNCGGVNLFSAETGIVALRFNGEHGDGGPTDHAVKLAELPSSRTIVTGGSDGSVVLWSRDTGTVCHRIAAHDGVVLGMSSNGTDLLTWGSDGVARVWSKNTGEQLCMFNQGCVTAATYISVDNSETGVSTGLLEGSMIVLADTDGSIRCWNLSAKCDSAEVLWDSEFEDHVIDALLQAGGGRLILAWSDKGCATAYDSVTGTISYTISHFDPSAQSAMKVVAGADCFGCWQPGGSTDITLWNSLTGVTTVVLQHDSPVLALALPPGDEILPLALTVDAGGTATLWSTCDNGQVLQRYNAAAGMLTCCALERASAPTPSSSNSEHFAVLGCSDGRVLMLQCWEAHDGTLDGSLGRDT